MIHGIGFLIIIIIIPYLDDKAPDGWFRRNIFIPDFLVGAHS